jgi:type II secretory ATPase GspE/PulE/Tfp pilus assembly ATPase PilB-like protein
MIFAGMSNPKNSSSQAEETLVTEPSTISPQTSLKTAKEILGRTGQIAIVELVQAIMEEGAALRASDIHIEPRDSGVFVRVRVDGVLQDTLLIPTQIHNEVISRIKVLASLRTDEHQAAQDGRFRMTLASGSPVDVRVSITPTYFGENAVLRLLSDNAREFTLESLGFSRADSVKIETAIHRPHGMILATGPTGSGKTTTLYTLVKMLNHKGVSIVTIEDPIEYAISGITQIQVNQRSSLTFATGLRSILRQDPNIIMVGEIRDAETAGIAVNTALTGHLLLSTLHTNDASTTLPRLLDMGIDAYLVASTVNIAIGQRLVRRICASCKEQYTLTKAEHDSLLESLPSRIRLREEGLSNTFYRGRGCPSCDNTGYSGRVSINEVLVVGPEIRDGILRKVAASTIKEIAIEQGMTTMFEDGLLKATLGVTTIAEVLRTINE